ncbi:alpha-D-ribose 1-methylphosphonate 5-triphosphate diphosphatase [Roseovarius sp. PS-C2]|uniref:alpha-D-ribose 1-methylphosphonate 5-triphosphate diphosphatase n=1 Tax=Roseovarius sp. PS-C2 TaxID=2820814 RepID=UPI001C0B2F73|nr:alpha-D-ribose 1-methylphosphonate 5-triphosphate diphosphatase [Roseovarius sp. PS-C2]MBU3259170.1 alpha-D-ribose 1-methylphosphonate 5-triphosphate diphosphatase [Roseovarius sp. PS-C2]
MPAPADLSLAPGAETLHLANARLVLPDTVLTGSLSLSDGRIAEITPGTHVAAGAIDCDGDYITPGLIELHTDNLERHIEPRPSVDWPHLSAILAHDGELASTGITTVFDAMRVGSIHTGKGGYVKYARALTDEILALRRADALRISHFLHLRAEICSETLLEELAEFTPEDRIGIVSLMDHTPGQRQFRDLSKLKTYIAKKRGMSDADFEAHVTHLKGLRARLGDTHETGAIAEANRLGAVLASHDDTTAEQVTASQGNGVGFAEFPTTIEAAEACRDKGVAIMMGAPNIIRGGSHSGNVSALDLAGRGLLDIVSSDYVPSALLLSAFRLGEVWQDLPRAIRTVTAAPAEVTGLTDRGHLIAGQRADLLRIRDINGTPVVRTVWSRGRQVG